GGRGGWLNAALLGAVLGMALLIFNVPPFNQLTTTAQTSSEFDRLEDQIATIGAAQAAQATQQAILSNDRSALRDSQATAEAQIEALDAPLATLQAEVGALAGELAAGDNSLSGLNDNIDELEGRIDTLDAQLFGLQATVPPGQDFIEYDRQILLVRSWLELFEARTLLIENNPGEASSRLESALTTLSTAASLSTEEDRAVIDAIIGRVTLVIDSLVESPFEALSDLEVALRNLNNQIRPPGEQPSIAPTPQATPSPAPTEQSNP
ncbi:MAG: hypothetical protein GYB68_14240, partial [Chloroflexi bacterium]|nr:hypothetical protein [Chloroflexota bacterium]